MSATTQLMIEVPVAVEERLDESPGYPPSPRER